VKKTKKSHFIPRFFIKKFCDANGNLYVYNIEKNEVKLSGPSDKAFRKNWLYSYYEKNEKGELINIYDNEIENILGLLESNVPLVLSKLDSGINLDDNEKDILRLFCYIQWSRTPTAITNSNKGLSNIIKKLTSMILTTVPENELKGQLESEISKNEIMDIMNSENLIIDIDKPSVPSLQHAIELFKLTGNIKLKYDVIKTDQVLLFGENPVIIKLPMISGVEIIMPISTYQLLYIHSFNVQNKIEKIIDALNKVQLNQTDKYVFFQMKPENFDLLLTLDSHLNFSFQEMKIKN